MTDQMTETTAAQAAPAPVVAPVGWAQVPRVNLMPPEFLEERRFRRTRRLLVAGVLGVVLIAAAGVVVTTRSVTSARDRLDTATAQVANLQAEETKYQAVPALSAQIDAATKARAAVMSQDILWYRMLADIDAARPGEVATGNIAVNLSAAAPAAASATKPDPLTASGIGTVTLTGTAGKYEQVSAWIEALNAVTGLDSTALSDAAKTDDGSIDYTVSTVVTDAALSHRYSKKGR